MARHAFLSALATLALLSTSTAVAQIHLPFTGPRAADGPLLPRVRAHEFESRCTAPVSDAPSGEQAESYDLLDTLSGAPLTSRNDVATVGSSGTDAKLNQIVRIYQHVAPPPPGFDVNVFVQNTEDIDARQFGAGQILLTRGLVTALRNQPNVPPDRIADQFAFILAHEYAHVLLCHYTRTEQMSQRRDLLRTVSAVGLVGVSLANSSMTRTANGAQFNTDAQGTAHDYVPVMAGLTVLRTFNSSVVNPAWSRAQERDADRLAVELMTAAHFHPDNLGDMLGMLHEADSTYNRTYSSVLSQMAPQAIAAGAASLNQNNSGPSLGSMLQTIGLNTGIQMLQTWRGNQLRHFHDDPVRREAELTALVQGTQVSAADASQAASAYAAMDAGPAPDRASLGSALLASANSEMAAPDLAIEAIRLLASNNIDGGCDTARRALAAGPNDITALSASGQCSLARHDTPAAARVFDTLMRQPQATPEDYNDVSTLWAEVQERPRAQTALDNGAHRFGADRFYVPRITLAGRFQDTAGVQSIAAECASSAKTPETKTACAQTEARFVQTAATQSSGTPAQQTNPLGNLFNSLNRVTTNPTIPGGGGGGR
jgi:predicted Zn-dependent protease